MYNNIPKDIIFGILTFVVAFSFREFFVHLLKYCLPELQKTRILFLFLLAMLLLLFTIGLANLWENNLEKKNKEMSEDAFLACQNTVSPRTPSQMQQQHSAAIAMILQQLGLTNCKTFDTGTAILGGIVESQTAVSIGCEQVAVMSQAIDVAQRVLQCTTQAVSQTTQTQVMTSNDITVRLSDNASIQCLSVQQTIQAKVASVGEFGTQLIQSMGSYINDTIKTMATNVQDSSKDITTVQGQKSVMAFTEQLAQTANQSSFTDIVQEAINNFQASNNFTLEMTGYSFIGAATPVASLGNCVTINQLIMMEVLVQNIMDASLDLTFSSDVAHEFTAEWINAQKAQSESTLGGLGEIGEIISGIIIVLILIALIVVAVMMLRSQGNNNIMQSSNGSTDKGKGISIFFIVLGVIVFAIGIASAASGFSTIFGGIAIALGVICIAIAGYMLHRAIQKGKEESTPQTSQPKPS